MPSAETHETNFILGHFRRGTTRASRAPCGCGRDEATEKRGGCMKESIESIGRARVMLLGHGPLWSKAARPILICVLLFTIAGCYTSTLENTEFPKSLDACRTLAECEAISVRAIREGAICSDHTTIYLIAPGPKHLSCEDARDNLQKAEGKVAKLRDVEIERQRSEQERERQRLIDAQEERARKMAQEHRDVERARLSEQIDHQVVIVTKCAATKDARDARARHMDILQNQDPATFVQKHCTPKREMNTVRNTCTDDNGFVRSCTKQVPGEVIGYSCPKNLDPEVVKLGLFRLGMADDGYPFPEDRGIGVGDDECDRASTRLNELRIEMGAPAGADSGGAASGGTAP